MKCGTMMHFDPLSVSMAQISIF